MCKVYGYARISRKTQNIERQIRNITAFNPTAKIYKEAYTGRTQSRPEFQKMLKNLKSGDTVIFDSVSRMSRNAKEGTDLYFRLFNDGINMIFLKERHIDSAAYQKASEEVGIEIDMRDDSAEGTLITDIVTALNKFMRVKIQDDILKAFEQAEKEVQDLKDRTIEGIDTARRHGKQIGRVKDTKVITKKSIAAKEIIKKHSRDFGGTLSDSECMKLAGCSRNSYYRYKAAVREESED